MAISTFQFKDPVLTLAKFQMLPKPEHPDENIEINITRNVTRNNEKNEAIVEILLQLNKRNDEVKENASFVAEVAMNSLFSWQEGMAETDIESLLRYNAVSLLISYIRPVISNMTYMSPIAPCNLPFINLQELVENKVDT